MALTITDGQRYMVRFLHYEKTLALMPGLSEGLLATLNGLSLDDYLARIAALVPLHPSNGEWKAQEERPLAELLEGLVGVIDSSAPDPDPSAQPRHTLFGKFLVEKFRKQK